MPVETIINNFELALFSVYDDKVGACDGKINGDSMYGVSALVNPDPKLCQDCKFKEMCLDSKID